MTTTNTPEWHHPVIAAEIDGPTRIRIEAEEAERTALAARLGLAGIASLKADVVITPEAGRYHVDGLLDAQVTYTCIRTAKPFDSAVNGTVEGWYIDRGETISFAKARKKRADEEGDQPNFTEEKDDPEDMENGAIDLGELAAQSLSLALDDYPVSPDAPEPAEENGEAVKVENPFAVLSQLRQFMGDDT